MDWEIILPSKLIYLRILHLTHELVGSLPSGNNILQLGDAIFTMTWVTCRFASNILVLVQIYSIEQILAWFGLTEFFSFLFLVTEKIISEITSLCSFLFNPFLTQKIISILYFFYQKVFLINLYIFFTIKIYRKAKPHHFETLYGSFLMNTNQIE